MDYMMIYVWLVVTGTFGIYFHLLGMSSSQLTNSIIFQRGRAQPPTSHQIGQSQAFWDCELSFASELAFIFSGLWAALVSTHKQRGCNCGDFFKAQLTKIQNWWWCWWCHWCCCCCCNGIVLGPKKTIDTDHPAHPSPKSQCCVFCRSSLVAQVCHPSSEVAVRMSLIAKEKEWNEAVTAILTSPALEHSMIDFCRCQAVSTNGCHDETFHQKPKLVRQFKVGRRKFRSETSDNMDSWKAEVRRVRREKIRRKKMQMREKVGKSRFTVFFQWFVAPEGRKVGSLKRRVRTQLARWEMKKCTPLWREAHFQLKMYKTHQPRTTFGSCDVEKVHAVVARSTFRSQKC